MPKIDFGQKISFGGSDFIRLKSKGDKAHFRFAGSAVYEGKHFITDDYGNIKTVFCPHIMGNQPCEICKNWSKLMKEMKEEKSEAKRKDIERKARDFKVAISFFYPVLDRTSEAVEEHKAKILQTTTLVRQAIEAEVEAGIDVLEVDYILTRNEGAPATYYSLIRLDSKDTKKLTDAEWVEYEKAKMLDIEEILGHKVNKSSLSLEAEK